MPDGVLMSHQRLTSIPALQEEPLLRVAWRPAMHPSLTQMSATTGSGMWTAWRHRLLQAYACVDHASCDRARDCWMRMPQGATGQARWRSGTVQHRTAVALPRDLPGHGDRCCPVLHWPPVVPGRSVKVSVRFLSCGGAQMRHCSTCEPAHTPCIILLFRHDTYAVHGGDELQAPEGEAVAESGGGIERAGPGPAQKVVSRGRIGM
jgi:hypothetical protein